MYFMASRVDDSLLLKVWGLEPSENRKVQKGKNRKNVQFCDNFIKWPVIKWPAEKSPVSDDRRESVETAERGRHFLEARRDKKGKTSMKKLYFPVSCQTEAPHVENEKAELGKTERGKQGK